MHEIELRFQVPAGQTETLLRWLRTQGRPQRLPLAAIYYDTADRALARAGLGLRLRREGARWVQTCKGPAEDGITRLEHNSRLAPGAAPLLDLTRHAAHPLGAALANVRAPLIEVFRTEVLREHWVQKLEGARIEMAWDEGRLQAGGQELLVHEIELELLDGHPQALLAHAHQLVAQLPLCLDLRSKAERGQNLARGLRQSPPRELQPLPPLLKDPAQALRALLLNGFDAVAANASQIATGASEEGHLQQLRAGLQRLSDGLRRHKGVAHPALPGLRRQAEALLASCPKTASPVAWVRAAALQQFLVECLGWIAWLSQKR